MGNLSVLNCCAGDIRITVTKDDKDSIETAKKMIQDMLSKGYLIAIEGPDGQFIPVDKFDPDQQVYVITEKNLDPAAKETKRPKGRPRGAYKKTAVPMDQAKAIAVPRTAGG